ncbi:low affinity immunoglobulin gamma Fc region receptor III-like isoform X3 [Motacilla alba alba]|uniref:low affinity immunoglobulin gamma Fc region receptor III-like isoform X3 n=1 Tax=Motacilla alba alba TaxID=1094192 RepID=UPI0018D56E57|nr:low affinity immunoglobulin gamma Fc region receptor III-like isoform X3 [Motacilla alba alba]
MGTDVTSLPSPSSEEPPARGAVATAASDSQSTWLGTPGWPGRWCCSCGPRPSASLVLTPPRSSWSPPGGQRWDRVTLTCQGSGTTGAITWYKDGQRWWQGRDHVTVIEKGTYMCYRPGTGRSPTMKISDDWLVLQVPARALLEGDTVTLY